jgi:hypothetical protein
MIVIIVACILGIIVLILLGFAITGLLYKPNPLAIAIAPIPGSFNKKCTTEQVLCNPALKGSDCKILCKESQEGEEMECVTLNRYTKDQISDYGPEQSVCLPANAKLDCNAKLGGIKVWSGWSNPDRMEWDCMCSYPGYVGGTNCSTFNANICNGGTGMDNLDVTTGGPPSASDCTCPASYTLMYANDGGYPICAPSDMANIWYSDLDKIK